MEVNLNIIFLTFKLVCFLRMKFPDITLNFKVNNNYNIIIDSEYIISKDLKFKH